MDFLEESGASSLLATTTAPRCSSRKLSLPSPHTSHLTPPIPNQSSRPVALPAVLALAILGISVSGPLSRLSGAHPLAIAIGRLTFALLFVGAALVWNGSWREWRTLARRDLALALGAGFFLALHFWSWISSLGMTTVAASVVLVNLHPVVVVAGSALWLSEKPTRRQLGGLALALAGAALVAWGDASAAVTSEIGASASAASGLASSRALLGDLLALVGAVTVGLYYLAGRSLRQRLSLWPYVGLVYSSALVSLLALALVSGAPIWPQPRHELLLFAGIAFGPMLLGHTGFNWALKYVPAYVVSLAVLAEPVGATALAALLPGIGEIPSAFTLLGGAVILGGLVLGTLQPADRPAT